MYQAIQTSRRLPINLMMMPMKKLMRMLNPSQSLLRNCHKRNRVDHFFQTNYTLFTLLT